jgi:hypothetical protein
MSVETSSKGSKALSQARGREKEQEQQSETHIKRGKMALVTFTEEEEEGRTFDEEKKKATTPTALRITQSQSLGYHRGVEKGSEGRGNTSMVTPSYPLSKLTIAHDQENQ